MSQGPSRRSPDRLKVPCPDEGAIRTQPGGFNPGNHPKPHGALIEPVNSSASCFLTASSVIDPVQKFDEPLAINPKENLLIFWIVLGKFLIATTESGRDVYPDLTFD
jgi:hypothetical protein